MNGISDRLLSNLNPAQRCSVIFSALSRDDIPEAHRLVDTAPTGTYVAADFMWTYTRAMLVAGLARGDIEQQVAGEWANRCFWATCLQDKDRDDNMLDAFWTAASYHRTRTRSLWAAFAQAVSEAGMDPREVMQSMGGLSKRAQETIDGGEVIDGGEEEAADDALTLYRAMLGK